MEKISAPNPCTYSWADLVKKMTCLRWKNKCTNPCTCLGTKSLQTKMLGNQKTSVPTSCTYPLVDLVQQITRLEWKSKCTDPCTCLGTKALQTKSLEMDKNKRTKSVHLFVGWLGAKNELPEKNKLSTPPSRTDLRIKRVQNKSPWTWKK